MDDGWPSSLSSLLTLFILILLNAFFSASEMAVLSIDKNRLENMGNEKHRKARKILSLLKEHAKFLSAIQIGITLTGFLMAGYSALFISTRLARFFRFKGIPYAGDISFFLVTLVLAFLVLVFGEFIPKRIAIGNSYRFAMFAITPLSLFYKIVKPIVFLSNGLTSLILKILGISRKTTSRQITLEELKSHIELSREQGIINPLEKTIIDSAISFDDKLAEEIMTARTAVFAIDITKPIEYYISKMMEMKYSRIPIYEDDIDNIIGVVYIKDYMLQAYKKGFDFVDLKKVMKPAYFVPERKNISDLFIEMQENRIHMAILIDEYGGFSGIVTMEDLLEEIVGNIEDEYDHEEPDLIELNRYLYLAKGNLSIKEMNHKIGCNFSVDEDYDTLGGLLISHLGFVPDDGVLNDIVINSIQFNIKLIQDKRIKQVMIKLPKDYFEQKEVYNDNN